MSGSRLACHRVAARSGLEADNPPPHPEFVGSGSGGRDQSGEAAFSSHGEKRSSARIARGGSGRADEVDPVADQAVLRTAPAGTSPWVSKRHRAMSSLRARAMIITFLVRAPPDWILWWNHWLRAEAG